MIVQYGMSEDSEKILSFLSSIFKESSLSVYCSDLKEKLRKSEYKSIFVESNGNIVAHIGMSLVDNIAIFNNLAISPEHREEGLAKKLLAENINYCLNHKSITHAIGYCVLQHPWSEKIHGSEFKSVGLMPVSEHPLKNNDPLNKQNIFSGNLVLCRTFQDIGSITVGYAGNLEQKLAGVCSNIGADLNFQASMNDEYSKTPQKYIEINLKTPEAGKQLKFVENYDYAFLGLAPNINSGLLNFGFMLRNSEVGNPDFVVSTEERSSFVRKILADLVKK